MKSFMDLNFAQPTRNNNSALKLPYTYAGDNSNMGSGSIPDNTNNSGSYLDQMNGFGKTKMDSAIPVSFGKSGGGGDTGFDSLKLFGAASQGLAGLGALLQAYNGYKQVQLGRDTFDFQKSSYNQDSANQARLVNSELQDRQAARISSTGNNNAGGVYDSLGSYMDRNKVSARPL